MSRTFVFLAVVVSMLLGDNVSGETAEMVDQAAETLRKATDYFRRHVGREGGYLWRYSEELDKAEGEGKAGPRTVWVEPPGTPAVGLAWLDAYRVTHDRYYLEAAREVGNCLVRGQLESGGWDYRIELAPVDRKRYGDQTDRADQKVQRPKRFNRTTLDEQGRWIETDSLRYHGPDDPTRRVIKTPTFLKHVGFLIVYIEIANG